MVFSAGKPRVEPRIRAMVRARMRDASGERDVCLIDFSTRGLLATTARPPKHGEFVEIVIGNNRLAGQVMWSGDRRFGLSLQERVSVAAMVEGGKGPVALQRAPSRQVRRTSMWQGLRENTQILGRVGQLAMLLVAIGGAGLLIFELVGTGFEPMQAAVHSMNEGNG